MHVAALNAHRAAPVLRLPFGMTDMFEIQDCRREPSWRRLLPAMSVKLAVSSFCLDPFPFSNIFRDLVSCSCTCELAKNPSASPSVHVDLGAGGHSKCLNGTFTMACNALTKLDMVTDSITHYCQRHGLLSLPSLSLGSPQFLHSAHRLQVRLRSRKHRDQQSM